MSILIWFIQVHSEYILSCDKGREVFFSFMIVFYDFISSWQSGQTGCCEGCGFLNVGFISMNHKHLFAFKIALFEIG